MMLTWTPNPVPYDQAFEAIKSAIDALPGGVKLFINGGTVAANMVSQITTYLFSRRILRQRPLGSKFGPARCILRGEPWICG
jgi:hypothetical protein